MSRWIRRYRKIGFTRIALGLAPLVIIGIVLPGNVANGSYSALPGYAEFSVVGILGGYLSIVVLMTGIYVLLRKFGPARSGRLIKSGS